MKKWIFLLLLEHCFAMLQAKVSIPQILADHMVLQQNSNVDIWGWASAGEAVHLLADWSSDTLKTRASNEGHWKIELKTPAWGGPYNLSIWGSNKIVLRDILIGEVWLCSGQSNMEWNANAGINNAAEEIRNAIYPDIRFFDVENRSATFPQMDLNGSWQACTPESMQSFSAVAYFFARQVYQETGMPIGLINSSWGGTPAESWIPNDTFDHNTELSYAASLLPDVPWGPSKPAVLYNAMIAPLTSFRIAGVLWYQGESNSANPEFYEDVFSALIDSWRRKWSYEFPFYFVQIAPFRYGQEYQGVIVRDQQRRCLKLPKTAMVVTSDIGNINDIHPRNKQDVGLRLANIALNEHYRHTDQIVHGPLFKAAEQNDTSVIVSFDHAEGLHSKNGMIVGFELAAEDDIFHSATARITGEKVIVQSTQVSKPVKLRFAWRNISEAELFNRAGLPASSFITRL